MACLDFVNRFKSKFEAPQIIQKLEFLDYVLIITKIHYHKMVYEQVAALPIIFISSNDLAVGRVGNLKMTHAKVS